MEITRTQVGIVGGGPAGLLLSHLLSNAGIDNVVLESRSYETIAHTHRAGILEQVNADMLRSHGINSRINEIGDEHSGIDLRFNGESHHLNFPELVGATVNLYPQNEVFVDLADTRLKAGGDIRFEHKVVELLDVETEAPKVRFQQIREGEDAGELQELQCRFLVGADGSHSFIRRQLASYPESQDFKIEYPFAWFGILCEAEKSAPELIYANSPRGFALISQRSESVQRMYFQCDTNTKAEDWTDERIWDELQARVAGPDGFQLKTGPIIEKTVLPFRSFVREPLSQGSVFLAGDAGHTVPPTGAKGLNLAFADIRVLFPALERFFATGNRDLLVSYSETALRRVWRAQNFSYWMTRMLHTAPGEDAFSTKRALGELDSITSSEAGKRYLAECYTGWPNSSN